MKNKINKNLKIIIVAITCLLLQIGIVYGQTSGNSEADVKKQFAQVSAEFNPLSQKYTEKVNAMNLAKKNKTADKATYCKTLIELDDTTPGYESLIDKLSEIYYGGDGAKVMSEQNQAIVKDIVQVKGHEEFNRKIEVWKEIAVNSCREDAILNLEKVMTDLNKKVNQATAAQLIRILRRLGNMPGYFTAGKTFNSLTSASTNVEICQATSEFRKESEKIEPDIEEFADLYQAKDPIGNIDESRRSVEFADPQLNNLAERTLQFRAKLFLLKKDDIKKFSSKYGCQ